MEEKKYTLLPADDAVQNWCEQNIDKECSASSAIYKFRLWLESLQRKAITGAVWVRAITKLPTPGKITWRWLDKAEAYSGYDEKRGFIYGTGGASVDPTYYSEIEWLDESGTAAGREEDAVAFVNWTLSSECDTYTCTDEDQWTNIYTQESITTTQLYELFNKQKEK